MIIRRLLIPCLLALFSVAEARAELFIMEEEDEHVGSMFVVILRGDITAEDQRNLPATALAASRADSRAILLDSRGGDLDAAMAMGRYLRMMEFDVLVMQEHSCLSACVFLLAAGINKTVEGEVGIHRPYYTSGDPARAAEGIKATKDEVVAYLDEMNIPARLAEDMFSISPSSMRILSELDLRDYRLNSKDYVTQEVDALESADNWGVSRDAYEAFDRDVDAICDVYSHDPRRLYECMKIVAEHYGIPAPPHPTVTRHDAPPEPAAPAQDAPPETGRSRDSAGKPTFDDMTASTAAQYQQLPSPRMAIEDGGAPIGHREQSVVQPPAQQQEGSHEGYMRYHRANVMPKIIDAHFRAGEIETARQLQRQLEHDLKEDMKFYFGRAIAVSAFGDEYGFLKNIRLADELIDDDYSFIAERSSLSGKGDEIAATIALRNDRSGEVFIREFGKLDLARFFLTRIDPMSLR